MCVRGFTLVECLVALALTAIVFTFALPNVYQLYARYQQRTTVNALIHHLNYARQRAILNKTQVCVCPTQDDLHCSGGWGTDLLVMSARKVLHVFQMKVEKGTLTWHGFASPKEVCFSPSVLSLKANGYFMVYDPKNKQRPVKVIVNRLGRARKVHQRSSS